MNAVKSILSPEDIIRILPQKPPAVLIDKVLEIEPGNRILAVKNVTMSEPAMNGHFPGLPIFPGNLLIEVAMQACCLLAYATDSYEPSRKIANLIGVNKARFHRTICAGSVLEIEVENLRKRSNVWRFSTKIYESDFLVMEMDIGISIIDRENAI